MMRQFSKTPDLLEAGTLRSRSTSVSSDSQLPRVNLMSPPSVRPPPEFIALSAASEIITADQEFNAADFVAEDDDAGTGASALVTPAALSLLNGFLDNILFNILAASRSTQLTCIRPAVADVLKPRLASEVVSAADEELSEYIGGVEDEQVEFRGGQEPGGEFDLVRAWKLTRLRCMVYTRLGDMEEDDEDEFIARDGLGENDGAPRRFSSHVDNITPAAAIFLTSIIEYIGERALVIAGETARSRLSAKLNDEADEWDDAVTDRTSINQLVVEDLDMEKLALNATLGRLWRMWKKRRRATPMSRTLSRESFHHRGYTRTLANSRKSSIATVEEPVTPSGPALEEAAAPLDPASIPLPMTDYDALEIEIPGFSPELEGDVQTMEAVVAHKVRPRSLMVFSPSPSLTTRSPASSNGSPKTASAVENAQSVRHTRSRSLPTSASSPQEKVEAEPVAEQSSTRSSEERKRLTTMYEDDESAEYVDAAETTPGIAITTPHESTESVAETVGKIRMSIVREEEEEQEAAPADNEDPSLQASVPRGDSDPDQGAVSPLNSQDGEISINQPSSARASISSLSDPGTQDAEVIEGRGMCEKPKLTAIQRPKRRASRDATQIDAKPIDAESIEPDMQPVAELDPPAQGMDCTPASSVVTSEAVDFSHDNDAVDGDQNKSVTPSTSPQIVPSDGTADAAEAERQIQKPTVNPEEPRPASTTSDRSRRKPTPLVVVASNRSTRRTDSGSSTATERAAVQRMPLRPSTAVASPIQSRSRRSESFSSHDKRPVTASSTTSQVSNKLKGLMGRSQGDSPSLRLRSSSETSRASGGSGDSLDEATELNLDRLINSDETLHYTLTPKSVREMTFPEPTPQIPRAEVADTADLATFLKSTAPPGEDASRSRTSTSSRTTAELNSAYRAKPAESPRHVPIGSRMSMSAKSKAGQARDARPPRESTREFAAFIKATGPSGTPTSAPYPYKASAATETASRLSSVSASSRANRPRLEARAAETKGSETSDLIDFIREGPPIPGAHRIPRTVAPFRNTVDSDDLQFDSSQINQEKTTRSPLASIQGGSTPNKSLTSLGSRTGLLDSASKVNGQSPAAASGSTTARDDPRPKRKQRRVPDPYAIDDSDDDELLEELLDPKPKPKREEESLMDFLRDAPPPEMEEHPQPLAMNLPPSGSNGNAGAAGMTARLFRTAADKVPSPKISRTSLRSSATPNYPTTQSQSQSNYSFKVGMERNGGATASTPHRQTETSALADFLRNTEPPGPPAGARPAPPAASGPGSLSRFFVRRKKVEA